MRQFTILSALLLMTITTIAQDDYDNRFYFRFGYSNPSWTQFGSTESDWADGVKRSGFMGEIGTIFMLNGIPMPDKTVLGIDVDYLSGYWNQFSYESMGENIDLITIRADSKIGPSFSYNPVSKLFFDIYVKADISWFTGTAIVYDNQTDDADGYSAFATFGLSTGVNIRYGVLMLGFEFNTISPKLENVDNKGDYLGNMNEEGSDKSPLPTSNFTIGLNF